MTYRFRTAIENALLALIGTLMIIIALNANAAVSKKPQGNSLGFLQYTENPYTYVEGELRGAVYVEKNALVVRIQPRGTYALYTEDLLFCRGAAEKIQGKQGALVFVYERVAHESIQGIGCHELRFVDEIKPRRDLP